MDSASRTDARGATTKPPDPHVVVLFGATGDLARRKLLPGLLHLDQADLLPDSCRIVGTSLEDLSDEEFVTLAHDAHTKFSNHPVTDDEWTAFASRLSYVCQSKGPKALAAAVKEAEKDVEGEPPARLHYLSVPPKAALPVVKTIADAGLVEGSRIIMEKPFGTDLASAVGLNAALHEVFAEEQIFRIDHFLGMALGRRPLLPAHRQAHGRRGQDHLHRLP